MTTLRSCKKNANEEHCVNVIYMNNKSEMQITEEETLETFLGRVSDILQITIDEHLPGLATAENTLVTNKNELIPGELYHFVLVKSKQEQEEENDGYDSETSDSGRVKDSSEEHTPITLGKRKRESESFESEIGMPEHKRAALMGMKKDFLCPYFHCRKGFTESGNLKTHIRTHTGERPFLCLYDSCGKRFITKGHLKSHELIHTGDRPYVCDFPGCSKRYSRSGRLKIHRRTHTGERPFACEHPGCDKAFTEKGNLKTHIRIHSGERPYTCRYADCGKSFTTQGHLTDHERRHSGDRPFQCKSCEKAFMRSSTLKIHVRRHTGEKPYQCKFHGCSKAFSESGNLKTHMKTHAKKTLHTKLSSEKTSIVSLISTEESTPIPRLPNSMIKGDHNNFLEATICRMKESQRRDLMFKQDLADENIRIPLSSINQTNHYSDFRPDYTPKDYQSFTPFGNGMYDMKSDNNHSLLPNNLLGFGTPKINPQNFGGNSPLNVFTNYNFINLGMSPINMASSPYNLSIPNNYHQFINCGSKQDPMNKEENTTMNPFAGSPFSSFTPKHREILNGNTSPSFLYQNPSFSGMTSLFEGSRKLSICQEDSKQKSLFSYYNGSTAEGGFSDTVKDLKKDTFIQP